MAQAANWYAFQHVGTTSTGQILSVSFAFDAIRMSISNNGTVPLRFTVGSTAASTSDMELRPSEAYRTEIATHALGVMTTSTSTGGDDHRRFQVAATG